MAGTKSQSVWRHRADATLEKVIQLFSIAIIYLLSELAIWGISRLLSGPKCEFFSSIIGMAVVFFATAGLYRYFACIDALYKEHIKPLTDWINGQMGVGFVIPLIMLDPDELLSSAEIGEIIANFVLTNVIFWLLTYGIALYLCKAVIFCTDLLKAKNAAQKSADATQRPLRAPEPPSPTEADTPDRWTSVPLNFTILQEKVEDKPKDSRDVSGAEESGNTSDESIKSTRIVNWTNVAAQYPSIISFFLIFAVGAPVAAGTGNSRFLDGCATWFFWISAVRGQRCFKQSTFFSSNPRYKSVIATLLNPVLMTVFTMLAYTRAKAAGLGVAVSWVLDEYSMGTPIYALWTAGATGELIEGNRNSYFGAGDLALSILEVGILIWGFKLYECRRQLFSAAGVITVLVSIAIAATNVFLCVLLGVTLKLKAPEALAFAARSTTLALAKPAIETIGGNVPANAGLVVANGILGQLVYPFALSRMGVKKEASTKRLEKSDSAEQKGLLNQGAADGSKPNSPPTTPTLTCDEPDNAVTIAAGIAIGINGAAMGVAYLVENKSRAAPYAALSMTIFGVFTVLFTTINPFMATVTRLAELNVHA